MNEEHAEIIDAASMAYCRDATTDHDISIRILAMSPAWMIFSNNHIRVLPCCKTGFVTEECLAF
jgi:hypothetical protein